MSMVVVSIEHFARLREADLSQAKVHLNRTRMLLFGPGWGSK